MCLDLITTSIYQNVSSHLNLQLDGDGPDHVDGRLGSDDQLAVKVPDRTPAKKLQCLLCFLV